MTLILRIALTLAALAVALLPLQAAADPPARVGRLSLLEGDVTFRTDRQDTGAPATANWPISSGAILDTDPGGRAEIWIGSTSFRLDGGSRAEFTLVDDQRTALQVAQGSLALTVRDGEQADGIEIATPAGQIRFGAAGRYRIDVDASNGDTQVASRDGVAYMYRPGGELGISSGQRAIAYAADGWFVTENRADAFDAWADARDDMSQALTARRYVSPHMTGHEDLDRYGTWSSTPDYGQVWYPRAVPPGWAPYRYGRWAWISPWGWTWVDAAPWGFAPFHYGRWALIGGQWAWVPGAYTPRPVYAPALVAWVGNPGWSASFSVGAAPAVGWFPLAPREVFVPAYRCSPTYVRQVNVTNVTNSIVIDQVVAGRQKPSFVHRSQPQAVTIVPAKVVQSGNLITRGAWRPTDRHELAQAPVAAQAPGTTWLPPIMTAAGAARPEHGPLNRGAPVIRQGNSLSPHPILPSAVPSTATSPHPSVRALRPENESAPVPSRRFRVPQDHIQAPAMPAAPAPSMTGQTPPDTASPPARVRNVIRAQPEMPHTEPPARYKPPRPIPQPELPHPVPERQSTPPAAVQMPPHMRPPPVSPQPPAQAQAIQRPVPAMPKADPPPHAPPGLSNTPVERLRERLRQPNAPQ